MSGSTLTVDGSGAPGLAMVVRGEVEYGDQRGRQLGFPTANVALGGDDPDDGVWAGWLDRSTGERLLTAVSVGRRQTFYGRAGKRLLEAHVVDFEGDLYGEVVTVWLGRRLRGQRTFAGLDELVAQLRQDVVATRAWSVDVAWRPMTELPPGLVPGAVVRLPA